MESVAIKRKLIDLKPGVVGILSEKAAMAGLSLKRYLESVLEEEALKTERDRKLKNVHSPKIRNLVGIIRLDSSRMEAIEDGRLKYILSK